MDYKDYHIPTSRHIEKSETVEKKLSPAAEKMKETTGTVPFVPAKLARTVSKMNPNKLLLGQAKTTFPKRVAQTSQNIERAKGPWKEGTKPSSITQHKISQPGKQIGSRTQTKPKSEEKQNWMDTTTQVNNLFPSSTYSEKSARTRTLSQTVHSFANISLSSVTSTTEPSKSPSLETSEEIKTQSPEKTEKPVERNWVNIEFRSDLYNLDPKFDKLRENFLLTYRWQTDIPQIIQQMRKDFEIAKGDELKQQGILSLILQWLRDPNIHENEYLKPQIDGQIQEFLNEVEKEENPQIQSMVSFIQDTLANLKKTAAMPKMRVEMLHAPLSRAPNPTNFVKEAVRGKASLSAKRTLTTTKKEQMKRDESKEKYEKNVEAFERDLAAWGQQLMAKIEVSEFANLGWSRKKAKDTSPNILAMIEEHNRLTQFIRFTILDQDHLAKKTNGQKQAEGEVKKASEEQMKNAAKTIEYFIDVASKALKNHNYHSLTAIIGALEMDAIYRMKDVWKLVPSEKMEKFQQCRNAIDLEHKFNNLKNTVRNIDPQQAEHFTPFLAIYTNLFTAAHEGNPKMTETKMRVLADLTKELVSFKTRNPPKTRTIDFSQMKELEKEKWESLNIKTEGLTESQIIRRIDTAAHNLSLAFQPVATKRK